MHVVDILSPHRVAVATDRLRTKHEALQRLAELLTSSGSNGKLTADGVQTMLARREDTQSTGVGGGVAIPHAAMEDLEQIVGAVLLCPNPILRDDAFRSRLVSAVDGAQAFELIVAEEARPQ